MQNHLPNGFKVENYYIQNPSTGIVPRIKACKEVSQNQGDINHITGDVHFVVFLLPKKKTLLTIHDLEFIDRARGIKRKILKHLWLTLPSKKVRYITVISETTRRRLLEMCDIKPEKVVVIPNGINLQHLEFKPKDKIPTKPRILQIGARHNKNLPRLFDAVKGIDCVLEIVGELDPKYREQLKSNGINYENHINVPFSKIRELYESCDIVTFVSTYEGFGLPIIEAQAIGRPLITSNVSSMPEVAGKGACFVDPYDVNAIREGILKVIENKDYRKSLISNGFENVKRFDIRNVARQYSDLYEKF